MTEPFKRHYHFPVFPNWELFIEAFHGLLPSATLTAYVLLDDGREEHWECASLGDLYGALWGTIKTAGGFALTVREQQASYYEPHTDEEAQW